MEHNIKLIINGVDIANKTPETQRQQVKRALVRVVERLSEEATTAAEVEALAAAALAFNEIDLT